MGIDPELYAKTKQHLTDRQVRDLAVEMCVALGAGPFLILRGQEPRHALWRCEQADIDFVVDQEGNPIHDGTGDMLQVGVDTRFRGASWERGNWPEIANAAQWLESRLPGTTMWYGGAHEQHVTPLGLQERTEMWEDFVANGNRPYDDAFRTADAPQCRCCRYGMEGAFLGDYDSRLLYCKGCGYFMLKHSNGRVVLTRDGRESAVKLATDDARWANYEKHLSGEEAQTVAAAMCETQAGMVAALTCSNPEIRSYAATTGAAALG